MCLTRCVYGVAPSPLCLHLCAYSFVPTVLCLRLCAYGFCITNHYETIRILLLAISCTDQLLFLQFTYNMNNSWTGLDHTMTSINTTDRYMLIELGNYGQSSRFDFTLYVDCYASSTKPGPGQCCFCLSSELFISTVYGLCGPPVKSEATLV